MLTRRHFLGAVGAGAGALLSRPYEFLGRPAKLDRVVLRRVPEASTQALQLARSDLDIGLSLGQANLPLLRRVPSVTIQSSIVATSFVACTGSGTPVAGSICPKLLLTLLLKLRVR